MCQYSAEDGAANDWHLQHLGSLSLWAPGLSLSSDSASPDAGAQLSSEPTRYDDGPQPVADLGRAANRRRKAGWGCTASLRTHPRRFRAHGDAPPQPCASRAAKLGPALRRPAPLTCSSLPQSGQPKLCACETCRQRPQRSRDSQLGLDRLGRRTGRSPGQPATHMPADLNRNRKGAPSPPRSNGQVFDEASNPVTVAGRRCRASGRVRPCWDQAFPCCSPLTGRASRPLAASRPSRPVAALSYLTEGGRVPLGSVDWQ